VRTGGGEADDRVAGAGLGAVDDAVLLDEADAESREVVVARRVHAGHLGRLAADQRAPRPQAALDDALDHALGHVDLELSGGVVVEEEHGLGALHDDVVRAHRDEVDADRVVAAGLYGKAQLGADTVGAGDHHGPAVTVERYLD